MKNTDCLIDQRPHLSKYRVGLVGPVKDLIPERCSDN
jgi:hypothetical protein